jgi:hypothetical protein
MGVSVRSGIFSLFERRKCLLPFERSPIDEVLLGLFRKMLVAFRSAPFKNLETFSMVPIKRLLLKSVDILYRIMSNLTKLRNVIFLSLVQFQFIPQCSNSIIVILQRQEACTSQPARSASLIPVVSRSASVTSLGILFYSPKRDLDLLGV